MILFPAWFDNQEEGFYSKEVKFKKFCLPVEGFTPVALPLKTLGLPTGLKIMCLAICSWTLLVHEDQSSDLVA